MKTHELRILLELARLGFVKVSENAANTPEALAEACVAMVAGKREFDKRTLEETPAKPGEPSNG